MDAEELEETMLDQNNRTLKQITLQDISEASKLFSALMGDSAASRKKYIEEHSARVDVFV